MDKVLQALSPRYDAAVASWVPRRGVQGEGIRRRAKERSRQSASEVGAVSTARGRLGERPCTESGAATPAEEVLPEVVLPEAYIVAAVNSSGGSRSCPLVFFFQNLKKKRRGRQP